MIIGLCFGSSVSGQMFKKDAQSSDRPIDASTAFPYVIDLLTGVTNNNYYSKIEAPGNWELFFGLGAFPTNLIIKLIKKDFKITLIHSNWKRFIGSSAIKRIVLGFYW